MFADVSLSELRTAREEIQIWGELLDALGWDDPANGGEACTLAAPREQLQDLLTSALAIAVERLDEVEPRPVDVHKRPSEVVLRKVEEMQLFERLLDRVGWPDPEDNGGDG